MPRTSRKRNNRRNESTVRVTSNLSANAPEFIPIANDEATANQREGLVIQSMTFCGSSSASNSSGSNSNSNYAATTIISSIPDALKNKGQRDLLINLLNENKVDCVICYERVKNIEQTWNCRNCYQIMHLKCITVWFIKSHGNAIWRCPACQSEVTGKPKYVCYCGTLPNPYFNNVDIPHSCGQVCGLPRKNYNLNYDDCHHKCTLLCHPGPCPQCVVQVIRSCGCGKKQEYALCGQATQIVCNSICLKKLNCQIHECQKVCHAKGCGPCDKGCPQYRTRTPAAALALLQSSASFAEAIIEYNRLPPDSEVTEEELRALGLTPEELYEPRSSVYDSYYSTSNESDVDDDDFDVEVNVDDIDEIMQDIDFGYRNNSNFPVVLANPLSGYSGSHEFEIEYPVTDDDDDDNDDDEEEEDDVDADADADADDTGEEENDENNENNEVCFCGKSKRQVPCTPENAMVLYYSCGNLCEKKLSCENHLCQKVCHVGQCDPCTALSVNRCPCGKRPLTEDELSNRTLCIQPVPTCDQPCGKPLECGPPENPHLCEQNCHEGPCVRCELKTKYVCKCGSRSKEIKCNSATSELTCKKKCNKMMSCGKHRCMVLCCNAQEHICTRTCNGLLNCRQHRCERVCHSGSCSMCYEASFEELYCRCGNSFISPPIRCGTRPPLCTLPCSREHECGHPATHICHNEDECPPCIALTEKLCFGGHELRFAIPCHIKNVSCGMPCGIPLPCKRHTCTKPCHAPPCNTGPCQLPCNLPKLDCSHPCSKPCHNGSCPPVACKIMVSVSCVCGNLTEARMCSDPKVIEYRLQVKAQSMSFLDNIVDSSPIIKSYKILECTTECAKLERNRRIALALQIRNPDLSPNVTPRYSDFMKEFAKKDASFCSYVHEKLAELVTNAKQSKQNSRSHSFEVMKYEKRKLIHEYSEHFGCESVAYDAEPNRNVVATALKEKSWLPNYSVVEVVLRESGCPRVNPFASIQKRNTIILNKKF